MPYAKQPCLDCCKMIRKPALRCRSCHDKWQVGENNPAWKGGISKNNMIYKRIQKQRYPEKHRARQMVGVAVRAGKLVRQPCQWPGCGKTPTQSHHWSYAPGHELDVTDFCGDHHRIVDRITRQEFEHIRAESMRKKVQRQTRRRKLREESRP